MLTRNNYFCPLLYKYATTIEKKNRTSNNTALSLRNLTTSTSRYITCICSRQTGSQMIDTLVKRDLKYNQNAPPNTQLGIFFYRHGQANL